jgi:hypothetical protein
MLSSGIMYFAFGTFFTYFTILQVNHSGWGLFPCLLAGLATLDLGTGLKIIIRHFRDKYHEKNG